jgi:Calx-beta domain
MKHRTRFAAIGLITTLSVVPALATAAQAQTLTAQAAQPISVQPISTQPISTQATQPISPKIVQPSSTPIGPIFPSSGLLPSVMIGDATVVEGNAGSTSLVFTLVLSRAVSGPVSVAYDTVDGTAVRNSDYSTRGGIAYFAGNTFRTTISVPVFGDKEVEPNETMGIALVAASGARIAKTSAIGTIINDDAAAAVATSLIITPGTITVEAGKSMPIAASIAYSDGTVRPLASDEMLGVNPYSYDQNIAAALSPTPGTFAIQGVSAGTTTIAYSVRPNGSTTVLTTPVPVTVTSGSVCVVTSFRIRPIPLPVGGAFPIWGFCQGSTTEVALNLPVAWSVSNPIVIDVNPTTGAIINNDKPGSSLLTATLPDGRTATLPLAVRVHVTSATATPINVAVGGAQALSVVANLNDGTTAPVSNAVFQPVNNAAVAVFDAGSIVGKATGTTFIEGSFFIGGTTLEPVQTFPAGTYVFGMPNTILVRVPITVN